MKKIPNRSKSGFKYFLTLIFYMLVMFVVFTGWLGGSEPGPISIGFLIGSVIGLFREISFRLKYKKLLVGSAKVV